MPIVLCGQAMPALAAPPTFVNVCSGLGVNLPTLTTIAPATSGILGGVVDGVVNPVITGVNANLQTLNGTSLGLGVLDPATNRYVTVPGTACNVAGSAFQVANTNGLAIGGGVATGLGGTQNAGAIAADPCAIALGNAATTGLAGTNAIALGNAAGTAANISNAIAIGAAAQTTAANSVALGASASANRGALTNYVAPGLAALQNSVGEVSVGAANATRQITNLAAGSGLTDAVNLGQLRGAVDPLTALAKLNVTYVPDGSGNPTANVNLAGNANLPLATAQGRLTGLAPGALSATSRDAVNGAQLFRTGSTLASAIGGSAVFDPSTGQISTPHFTIRGANFASVGAALGAVDAALSLSIGGSGGGSGAFASNNAAGGAVPAAAGANAAAGGYGASASGSGSSVIGNGATDNAVANSTVVGNGAAVRAGLAGSNVALGQGAIAGTGAVAGYAAFGLAAPQTSAGEVSVGTPGAQRQVTNVAAGVAPTDAVNLGQLRGTSAALGASISDALGGGAAYNSAAGTVGNPSYTIQGTTYTNVGSAISALSGATIAPQTQKYVQVNSSRGAAAATAAEAVAVGSVATASGGASVALGYGALASGTNSVAIGAGSSDGGLANVVSVGAAGAERRITNVAAGTLSATSTDAVNGSELYQTNAQVASLGHTALQYQTDASGRTLSSVTLASDQGGPVIIHNLAPGVAANDAATISQVRAVGEASVQYTMQNGVKTNLVTLAGGSPGGVTIRNLASGVAASDAVNVAQLQSYASNLATQGNSYTDQQINNLAAYTQREIKQARSDAAGGTALALAASGLRYVDAPGKYSIAGATAYYHSQMGLAFGIGHTSDDGRLRLNASITAAPTMNNPDVGVVAGASLAIN